MDSRLSYARPGSCVSPAVKEGEMETIHISNFSYYCLHYLCSVPTQTLRTKTLNLPDAVLPDASNLIKLPPILTLFQWLHIVTRNAKIKDIKMTTKEIDLNAVV